MQPKKLTLQSANGADINLDALYQIAPSCFTEVEDPKTGELRHVVNFTTLRQLLGDNAVNNGDLVACFEPDVTEAVVSAMAEKMPIRVLFRDSCFKQDDVKINIFETLKQKLDWSEEEALKNIRVI